MKKLLVTILAVGVMMLTSFSAFAAESSTDYNTPAEAVAGLTGRTVDSVIKERFESGKTYGTIAKDAGVLDEFKSASLNMKKEHLASQVKYGNLTQTEADNILAAIEANQAICTGTGAAKMGQAKDTSYGCGGANRVSGVSRGQGGSRGMGNGGMRKRDGSCYTSN